MDEKYTSYTPAKAVSHDEANLKAKCDRIFERSDLLKGTLPADQIRTKLSKEFREHLKEFKKLDTHPVKKSTGKNKRK
jgi:hypothetical protein